MTHLVLPAKRLLLQIGQDRRKRLGYQIIRINRCGPPLIVMAASLMAAATVRFEAIIIFASCESSFASFGNSSIQNLEQAQTRVQSVVQIMERALSNYTRKNTCHNPSAALIATAYFSVGCSSGEFNPFFFRPFLFDEDAFFFEED